MNIFFNILPRKASVAIPTTDALSHDLATSDFAYTVYNIPETNYDKRSSFSVLGINTNNPLVTFKYYSPMRDASAGFANACKISIYDSNWSFITSISPADTPDLQETTVDLLGTGVFYIIEPSLTEYLVSTPVPKGTHLVSVSVASDGVSLVSIPKSTNRMVVVGDSISVGDGTSNSSRYGWVIKLRDALRATNWSITSGGWGAGNSVSMLPNDTKQQEMADRAISEFAGATGRKVMLWQLGTNDYGYVYIDPPVAAARAGSVWDKMYAQDPTIEVILITPIIRENENNTNTFGHILQDYRDSLITEASTRAFVTAYDGKAVLTLADLSDGLHPNEAGHQKFADYVQTTL